MYSIVGGISFDSSRRKHGHHQNTRQTKIQFFLGKHATNCSNIYQQLHHIPTNETHHKNTCRLTSTSINPTNIWEYLSLDFITCLPSSHGFSFILVIEEKFSKGVHLGALQSHFTAFKVASLFMNMVCKHHGFPRILVSNRDPIFINRFLRELFKICGTKLRMSTTYHPETNDQTKVFNQVLEQYLCAFIHKNPNQWYNYLNLAEWSYNTFVHSSISYSRFEIIFRNHPPTVPITSLDHHQLKL